ncbi:MAG: preprotein translocase subunit YajC [Clostridia bacterium]|nr:preprotein translocase subunit YajC [Clostridia bacterium]
MNTQAIGPILIYVAIFVAMYFFLIRPQKKKDKQTRDMIAAIQVGDDILTIGGIRGTVTKIKDDRMLIETSKQDKTVIEIEKWAIKDVLKYVEDK